MTSSDLVIKVAKRCMDKNGALQKTLEDKTAICFISPTDDKTQFCKHQGDIYCFQNRLYYQCNFKPFPFSRVAKRMMDGYI